MTLKEQYLDELEKEAVRTRRAVAAVPAGKDDWAPHPKSMPLGRLAGLVASMPTWIPLIIDQPELDLAPPNGRQTYEPPQTKELVKVHDEAVKKAKASLDRTTEEHLLTTNWRLLTGGTVVSEQPRYIVMREFFTHLAHHRGQLTVYLRLLGQPVPALYGPSADDTTFA